MIETFEMEEVTETKLEDSVEQIALIESFYGDGKYSYYYRDDLTEKFCDNHDFKNIPLDEQIKPLLEFFCGD